MYPYLPVVVTGHSLGGAIATLAAVDLVEEGIVSPGNIGVWNFGSPRVGNQIFSDYATQLLPVLWRTVNQQDILCEINT
jgi:predicted lipase